MRFSGRTQWVSGLTIVEMLVTITIAAIIMGAALPTVLAWLPSLRLSSAARQVATDLQVARMRAIAQNVSYQLSFASAGATTYEIRKDANSNGVFTDSGELDRGPLDLPQGISASSAASPAFQARGTATAAVTITLTNGSTTKLVCVKTVGRVFVAEGSSC